MRGGIDLDPSNRDIFQILDSTLEDRKDLGFTWVGLTPRVAVMLAYNVIEGLELIYCVTCIAGIIIKHPHSDCGTVLVALSTSTA